MREILDNPLVIHSWCCRKSFNLRGNGSKRIHAGEPLFVFNNLQLMKRILYECEGLVKSLSC